MTTPEPQVGPETAREYVAELVEDAERARQAREAEAELGHDYEGRECQPGTPEHDQALAEYREWTNSPYVEAEADTPWGPPPTAEEQAAWARRDAIKNDHYHQVPARDEAEREAYARIEEVEAEIAEAEERSYHFNGAHVSDIPPHDYQCGHGCPYETEAERAARIDLEERIERQCELDADAEMIPDPQQDPQADPTVGPLGPEAEAEPELEAEL